MSESLAAVYLPIIPDASKIAPGVHKALGGVKQNAEKDGAGIGSKLSSGISKTMKAGAVATGAAVAGVLGTAMAKGFSRLTAIDSAEAKLSGLGHTATGVSTIMSDALAAVKGTAFGMGDAASAAAAAVAAGVKPGEDLQRTLTLMGDAAAIAGTDLNSMASIFNKVASTGKLQGDVLNQLGERGIPIIQLLGETMGVTADEVTKLASQGKIGFDELRDAIEHGMGGAALEAGNTFVGAMDNAGAALGRLGAAAMEPFFDTAKTGIRGFTDLVDALTDRVGPAAESLRDWLAPAAGTVADFIERARPAFDGTVVALGAMGEAAVALGGPLMSVAGSLGAVAGSVSLATWESFTNVLTGTAGVLSTVLAPALSAVAGLVDSHSGAVTALVAAWAAAKFAPGVAAKLGEALAPMKDRASAMGEMARQVSAFAKAHPDMTRMGIAAKVLGDNGATGFAKVVTGADRASQSLGRIAESHRLAGSMARQQAMTATDAFTSIDRIGAQAWHGVAGATARAGQSVAASVGGMSAAVGGAFQSMKNGASNLMTAMGGPVALGMTAATVAVTGLVAAYGEAKQSAERLAAASSSAVKAQRDLTSAVAGTSGTIGEEGMAAATRLATAELEKFHEAGQQGRSWTLFWRTAGEYVGVVSSEFQRNTAEALDNARAYDRIEEAAQGMGLTMEDVAAVAAEGGTRFEELRGAVEGSGQGASVATEELDELHTRLREVVEQARRVTPASAAAAEAIQDIADKAGTAETRVESFHRAMQQMRGIDVDAGEAASRLGAEIERMTAGMGELENVTLNANGSINVLANEGSRAAYDSLAALAEEMRGAAATGNDVVEVWNSSVPALEEFARATGLGEAELQRLLEVMGMTPEKLQLYAELEGDVAIATLEHLQTKIDTMGSGFIGTEIILSGGDEAIQALRDVGVEFTVIDGETGQVRIDAISDDARDKIHEILTGAQQLDESSPEVVALFDGTAVADGIAEAHEQADGLETRPISATADLDIEPLEWQTINAHGEVDTIDLRTAAATADMDRVPLSGSVSQAHLDIDGVAERTPTPTADLNTVPLAGSASSAHGMVDALDRDHAEPTANLDNSGVDRGVRDSRNWLQRLIDDFGNFSLNLNLSVVRRITDIFSSETRAEGGTIGALAAGGSIRDLTAGGQLPTTGPGTNVVDGFMGVDRSGVPIVRVDAGEEVINRKQAEKHRSLLKAINRGDPRVDDLPGFDTGGTIGSREGLDRALREAKSSHDIGARYSWGGISREASDCSGFVGRVAWAAQGRNPDTAGRMGTTDTMMAGQWPGFKRGRTGPFIVGVNRVHMAASLDGIPVESGGDVGGPSIGRGDGANDPAFTEHWYLDHARFSPPYANRPSVTEESEALFYGDDGTVRSSTAEGDARNVALSPEGQRAAESASQDKDHPLFGTGADSWSDLGGNLAKTAVSGQIASLLKVLGIPDQLPPLVKAGKTWYQQVDDDASKSEIKAQDEAVVEAAEATETAAAPAAGPVDDGTPQAAGRRAVAPRGWDTGRQWDALDYIYTKESNWDPHATNPSSGAFGIPQFNPVSGTLQQYLPDRSTDPFVQVTAGAQYIEDRYGDPISAQEFWKANQWYDRGGLARGKGHMLKNTLEPERVLSPEQTRAFEDLVFNKLDDLAGLAESVVSSGVSSAVGAGAGMADMVMPGAGAMLSPLGGPAGDIAGWYAGEVASNLIDTGTTLARDVTGIVGSQLDALSPVKLPIMDRPMPAAVPAAVPSTRPVGRAVSADGGGVHFHVADMHTAMTKARRIAADEARGLIGV